MTLGNIIAQYRKKMNITQDTLAQQLGVTNQAVSKWESDQCCPDVMLLPKIADIFAISMDELFGREVQAKAKPSVSNLDWPDDNILRVAMYVGRKLVCGGPAQYDYHYNGTVDGVLTCGSISCGDVMGNVDAGRDVNCGNVMGHVDAGCNVTCGDVEGNVDAGCNATCGNVEGSVDAGCNATCGNVEGSVDAGTDVKCGDVGGDVDAGCIVECGNVAGDIDANGPVTIRK